MKNIAAPITTAAMLGIALAVPAHADQSLNLDYWYAPSTPLPVAATITINANGSISVANPVGAAAFDGIEDSLVDVYNNSSKAVYSINLTNHGSGSDIFGFDGDGVSSYTGLSSLDSSGYGSPDSYFTNIVTWTYPTETGTVNFLGGISAGGTDYFSLEENLSASQTGGGGIGASTPDAASTATLLGGVLLTLGGLRRKFGFSA